jgi:hypothetical protein
MWTTVSDLFARHEQFVLGCLVTLILKAFYDLLKIGSIFGARQIRNKLSELSVSQLRKRIRNLGLFRDSVKSSETQDKILFAIRFALSVAMFMSLGTICMILDTLLAPPRTLFPLVALATFSLAIGVAAKGLSLAVLDNERRALLAAKVSADIDDLSRKLRARTVR